MADQKPPSSLQQYAPIMARLGLAGVFLWFGINQIIDPVSFMGYLPEFLLNMDSARTLVVANGIAELIAGILLVIGIGVRPVALLLGVHLIAIIISLGYNDIAVRDAGLLALALAVFFWGPDTWCLSQRRKTK